MKIAILHRSYFDPENANYLLNHCCQNWIQQGHTIEYINRNDGPLPPADLLFLHIDMTKVTREFLKIAEHYPVVTNRKVTDISKSVFSEVMIGRDDSYAGPVIIKTKNNYGGLPEKRSNASPGNNRWDNFVARFREKLELRRPWDKVKWLTKYPVFESLQEVPPGIWQNENLIVEKFLTERGNNDDYCLRIWIFLGDREIHYKSFSPEPIINSNNIRKRQYLTADEVPDKLRIIRSKFGFDYGKFDYVMSNGKPVLFDINKTPGAPKTLQERPGAVERVKNLSMGIEYCLQKTTA